MKITVIDYDPNWLQYFEELRSFLLPSVKDIALSIEHVGSTSIPGLAAKPIIDIDIVVNESDVPQAIEKLVDLGFKHRGDLGINGREAFSRLPDLPLHNLYLCPENNLALRNHLAVRDFLCKNHILAEEYGNLKKRLAEKYEDDIDSYVEGKTDFLTSILKSAGFCDIEIADIKKVNQKV